MASQNHLVVPLDLPVGSLSDFARSGRVNVDSIKRYFKHVALRDGEWVKNANRAGHTSEQACGASHFVVAGVNPGKEGCTYEIVSLSPISSLFIVNLVRFQCRRKVCKTMKIKDLPDDIRALFERDVASFKLLVEQYKSEDKEELAVLRASVAAATSSPSRKRTPSTPSNARMLIQSLSRVGSASERSTPSKKTDRHSTTPSDTSSAVSSQDSSPFKNTVIFKTSLFGAKRTDSSDGTEYFTAQSGDSSPSIPLKDLFHKPTKPTPHATTKRARPSKELHVKRMAMFEPDNFPPIKRLPTVRYLSNTIDDSSDNFPDFAFESPSMFDD